jgi:hypothetical protein
MATAAARLLLPWAAAAEEEEGVDFAAARDAVS